MRVWRKKIGPRESSRTASATSAMIGATATSISGTAQSRSKARLSTRDERG